MKPILNRIYSDYLMPSRLCSYEALVDQARAGGYQQMSVRDFFDASRNGAIPERALVHRHDIDSDLRTTAKLFAIESRYGVKASYYFRLSTLDFGLMREIEAAGSEASYHYEEVADFAKRRHLRDPAAVRARFDDIRLLFELNFRHIEARTGTKLRTVSSHGDFANRRLNIINHELLQDQALRRRCGIDCETYDEELLRHFDLYLSDKPYPVFYQPMSPFAALGRHARICFLTHPVQWETNWLASTRNNWRRVVEGVSW